MARLKLTADHYTEETQLRPQILAETVESGSVWSHEVAHRYP